MSLSISESVLRPRLKGGACVGTSFILGGNGIITCAVEPSSSEILLKLRHHFEIPMYATFLRLLIVIKLIVIVKK